MPEYLQIIILLDDGKMRIAFFEVDDWEEKYLKNKLNGHFLRFSKEALNLENAQQIKDFDAVSVFIYSKVDEQTIQEIPGLKLIATRSTAFDHIDLEECKKRGLTAEHFCFDSIAWGIKEVLKDVHKERQVSFVAFERLLCTESALEAINPLFTPGNVHESITNENKVFNRKRHICTNRSL